VRYLLGVGLVTLSTVPLASFVPLFMIEEVGLSSDQAVWLEIAVLVGAVASGYLWGWLADRYGSKPVMQSGVWLLPLAPLAWLLMPRGVALSLYLAVGIAVAQGLINTGWTLGSGRLLFVGIVPAERRSAYMALYYAWAGIAGGVGSVLGGWLVDLAADLGGQWWIVHFDPYTLLFLTGILFPLFSILLFSGVQADSGVTTRQFAGMFVRGNPFYALGSLVRYRRARDEREAIEGTERLGSTRSPLTVEELIEALHDPRFGVRFEAVVAMARHGEDPQLTDALIEVLDGNEPSLSTMAAWALGRLEDERALAALRRGMDSRYRSVQAHCIRSLGSLGDRTMLPAMLERLEGEQDAGVQLALASALGKLGATDAMGRLLVLLHEADTPDERREFALAIARLVGKERGFIQLQRRAETEPGTAFSQETTALKERLAEEDEVASKGAEELAEALDAAADALAREELDLGVALLAAALGQLAGMLPAEEGERKDPPCRMVVRACAAQMERLGPGRIEYVVLALHAAGCGLPEDGGLF
jgi:HEAT repeat protein